MKVVILAGGFGTRIAEYTNTIPKPMVPICGVPILVHIMRYFSHFGHNEFIILGGYKQEIIKQYFADYFFNNSDVTFDFSGQKKHTVIHKNNCAPWKVSVVNTGEHTMTGGRVKRIREYLENEPFFLTYGDGVSDVDLNTLSAFHKESGAITTITSVQPAGRFGTLDIEEGGKVTRFAEKKAEDSEWINGGFMVCKSELFDYISDDNTILERGPFENLAKDGKLAAYKHTGFWACMDSLNDKNYLENLVEKGEAKWIF